MSTDQTPTLGTRIREMQAAIQSEASDALDQHFTTLQDVETQTRELADIPVYDSRIRESLSRLASAVSSELNVIKRAIAASKNPDVAAA